MEGLKNSTLKAPNRIVVSPALGVAEQAFKIRDAVNSRAQEGTCKCEVVVDIQDAWPEAFTRSFLSYYAKQSVQFYSPHCIVVLKRAYHRS